jgi:hypothetical protein
MGNFDPGIGILSGCMPHLGKATEDISAGFPEMPPAILSMLASVLFNFLGFVVLACIPQEAPALAE